MKKVSGDFIYGLIGFILGGLTGGYFAGKMCANEYRKRIEELKYVNQKLGEENQKYADNCLRERMEAAEKEEKKVDKNLESLKKPNKKKKYTTAEIEKLSEAYRSDAFDAHFSERVSPDDSDQDEDEDDPFDMDDEELDAADEIETGDEIRVIDEATFKKDIGTRNCAVYTYYQEDGVLVDQATQEVEHDHFGVLGEDGMEIIPDTEQDFVYIDNEPDNMLYEVIVDHNMSYYRDVLGF